MNEKRKTTFYLSEPSCLMRSKQNPACFRIRQMAINRYAPVVSRPVVTASNGPTSPCVVQGAGSGYINERRKGFLRAAAYNVRKAT